MAINLATISEALRVGVARHAATKVMPYFSKGLHSMPVHRQPGFGTLAVTKEGVLVADPDFLAQCNADQAAVGLIHEYLHLYFRHHARFDAMCAQGTASKQHWKLANIAQDMEINDDLAACGMDLQVGPIKGIHPRDYGFPSGRSFEEYFSMLMAEAKAMAKAMAESDCNCGSGAHGHAKEGEPEGHEEGKTQVDLAIQGKVDAEEIGAVADKSERQGTIPARVKLQAKLDLQPKPIDWQTVFARHARQATSGTAGVDDYSYDRPSRYQPRFGGCTARFPGMVRLECKVALVADTSGSMSSTQGKLLSQAKRILAALPNAKLRMIACDAEVHADVRVASAKDVEANLIGGGGTSFVPAFQRLSGRDRPDLVVFFTDGFGTYPTTPPPFKVIWLVTPGGQISASWGTRIMLA